MSAAAAPWSVKGIDPKAREIAKDLARRQGLTLGDWLNRMIEDSAGGAEGPELSEASPVSAGTMDPSSCPMKSSWAAGTKTTRKFILRIPEG